MTHHKKIYQKRRIQAWIFICLLSSFAYILASTSFFTKFGISALIIAVVLGTFFGNMAHSLVTLVRKSGVLSICTKQILRLGVILYGFRITLNDALSIGIGGIVSAAIVVFSTFLIGYFVGIKLGLDKKSAVLISSGSSICGAAAVLATESIAKGGANRVGVAVCTVVVFGSLGMFLYPLIYGFGFSGLSEVQAGFMSGVSLHEVAHAVAAGNAIGSLASDNAVIVKMLRVLMLVPFLIFLSIFSAFFIGDKRKSSLKSSFPYFAVWFLVALVVGSLPFFPREFASVYINTADTFMLCAAMGALGLTITKNALKNSGKLPFILASVLFIWLIFIGYILSKFFG
ncbi:YeiH family putative sulfate export transporter [Campylobacter fetus]|uniref:YeiH/YadS family membrane protein n=3 Tax=Campylobacter fetus TaxID=196 RepID=A0AAE6IZV2_CAMFE|nr:MULTISPECIES: YeiH family putative sulfate export transporter [Campylobacter]OCS22608.1 hypothetical protein CFVI97532_03305 [Campylobacter fetus subsp. venerealis cfvi97/532]OCS26964.1 hypothetical protein CFVB10_01935 [Campylobacter fetus subsp. venerealis cfvB10]OCS30097.1 hypothetical protein CFVCCUG33900_03485 [Campylobacter fetus subsp. venerealis LMG 6570 = CCUG 33900]OCS43322.1 hypothetical protein CFVI02298_00115 [Campylobacter fetus subsp. venerealis cfvi02/298]ABK82569.1 membrane